MRIHVWWRLAETRRTGFERVVGGSYGADVPRPHREWKSACGSRSSFPADAQRRPCSTSAGWKMSHDGAFASPISPLAFYTSTWLGKFRASLRIDGRPWTDRATQIAAREAGRRGRRTHGGRHSSVATRVHLRRRRARGLPSEPGRKGAPYRRPAQGGRGLRGNVPPSGRA